MNYLINEDTNALAFFEHKLTVEHSLHQGTSLRKLEQNVPKETLTTVITFLIIRSMDYFNVGQKINDIQATILAMDLLELHSYENLEDIVLLFKYARQGLIGSKLFRIDSQVVLNEWFPQFLEKKAIAREKNWDGEKNQLNNLFTFQWDEESVKKLEVGCEAKQNLKSVNVTGMGSNMRKWLGQGPLTEAWGDKENPVDVEKMKKYNHKTLEETK